MANVLRKIRETIHREWWLTENNGEIVLRCSTTNNQQQYYDVLKVNREGVLVRLKGITGDDILPAISLNEFNAIISGGVE